MEGRHRQRRQTVERTYEHLAKGALKKGKDCGAIRAKEGFVKSAGKYVLGGKQSRELGHRSINSSYRRVDPSQPPPLLRVNYVANSKAQQQQLSHTYVCRSVQLSGPQPYINSFLPYVDLFCWLCR
uniref:Uncharacterized protein n=1 Tax=Trichogramma kaykai TaxID=54128 RepID=A0ABD2WXT0_9HYME